MWGEDWGSMLWGDGVTPGVPMLGFEGAVLLGLVALATALIALRRRSALLAALVLVAATAAPFAIRAQSLPNTFQNGTVADADEVNENFEVLADAVCQVVIATGTCLQNVPLCDAACVGTCGDGSRQPHETCDGSDLGGFDCTSVPGGFDGGTLQCDGSCEFDTSACVVDLCGNNMIDPGEVCDLGAGLPTCPDLYGPGSYSGSVVCEPDCMSYTESCAPI